ncbi:hypothetical protein MTO96_022948 [Rhipicephalus appendiculatus]
MAAKSRHGGESARLLLPGDADSSRRCCWRAREPARSQRQRCALALRQPSPYALLIREGGLAFLPAARIPGIPLPSTVRKRGNATTSSPRLWKGESIGPARSAKGRVRKKTQSEGGAWRRRSERLGSPGRPMGGRSPARSGGSGSNSLRLGEKGGRRRRGSSVYPGAPRVEGRTTRRESTMQLGRASAAYVCCRSSFLVSHSPDLLIRAQPPTVIPRAFSLAGPLFALPGGAFIWGSFYCLPLFRFKGSPSRSLGRAASSFYV